MKKVTAKVGAKTAIAAGVAKEKKQDVRPAVDVNSPEYRFEERVKGLMQRKNLSRKEAEQIVTTVIVTKEQNVADEPHISGTADGRVYFEQGDVRFSVDAHDINKVVGAQGEVNPLDKLMHSQIMTLARANRLPADPFAPELLIPVLTGIVQMIWYRDLEGHISDHLRHNQERRIETYKRALLTYRAPQIDSEGSKTRKQSQSTLWNANYISTGDSKSVANGREKDLLAVVNGFKKGASFAQIVEAAKEKVKTKQDLEMIVKRFLKELMAHGAVKEVQQ